jgi:hypothetical protein
VKKLAAVGILGAAALAARRYLTIRLQSQIRTPSGRGVTATKRHVGDSVIPVLVYPMIDDRAVLRDDHASGGRLI